MKAEMTTTHIKTQKPVTDSELVKALRNSMGPIFAHFEEELASNPERVLDIRITAKPGKLNLEYGIGEVANVPALAQSGGGTTKPKESNS